MTNTTLPGYPIVPLPADMYFTISGQKSISVLSHLNLLVFSLIICSYNLLQFRNFKIEKYIFILRHKCHRLQMHNQLIFFKYIFKNFTTSNQFKYLLQ